MVLLNVFRAKETQKLNADALESVSWRIALFRIEDGRADVVLVDVRMRDFALDCDARWFDGVAIMYVDGEMERCIAFWVQDQARPCEISILNVESDTRVRFGLELADVLEAALVQKRCGCCSHDLVQELMVRVAGCGCARFDQ